MKSEHAQLQAQLKVALAEKVELADKIKATNIAIHDLSAWLTTNANLADLPKDLPSIRIFRESLNNNFIEQETRRKTIADLQNKHTNKQEKHLELEKKRQTEQSALEAMMVHFKELAPIEYATDRQDLLEKMGKEIETIAQRRQYMSDLNELAKTYQQLLGDINNVEQQLADLRNEERSLDMAFLNNDEEISEAETTLFYKREVYRQQQAIANYEKDRSQLKEGEPCPLCFSTDHPFRSEGFTPFIDQAKMELEQAEQFFQQKQKERTALVKRLLEIASQTRQLDSTSAGELGKLKKQLLETEQKMAALSPHLDEVDFARSTGEWIAQKLLGFEENLQRKKTVREQLAILNGQISKQENLLRELEIQLKDSHFTLMETANTLKHNQQNINDLETKFSQLTSELNELVKKYGKVFTSETAKEMFAEFSAKEKTYSSKLEEKINHERQLGLDQQALTQTIKTIESIEKRIATTASDLQIEVAAMTLLKSKRSDLFDEKDPETERENLLKQLESLEVEMVSSKAELDVVREKLVLNNQSKKSQEMRLAKEQQAVAQNLKVLEKAMEELGFNNISTLRNAILPDNKVAQLETKAQKLQQRESELHQELRIVEKELGNTLKKNLTDQAYETLQTESKQLETNYLETQRNIGALQQQLSDNELLEEESAQLLRQIDLQRNTYNRWMALYDLIGSSDGKKFRVFAQGLTLQKLVQLANAHLENLFGRYLIIKRPGEDLELDIVDTYQADNIRSMHTLSGGESFLVSLALALGLSDLAGKNANIKSLFIDEGFGTLDEQALDLALNTLENLQAKGKTIGIISHVKELKERISTQVKVVKRGGGISHVEVVG